MTDLAALDATAQAELVHNGDASAAELVDAAIGRIEKLNGELNAVIHPLFDRADASGMVPLGHAGDGGGSIRIPASMCGLFGLKPARGRVSLGPAEHEAWHGLVMRHVVTRSVRDSAAVLDVLEGYMRGDWYSAPPPARSYVDEVEADPGRLRIGMRTSAPLGLASVDPECVAAVDDTARLLESLGHSVVQAAPEALDDGVLLETFGTVMLASLRADMVDLEEAIGRPVTPDDME